ncbi:hypothetical protein [Nostoc parmelioides]|uniref:Uncharacterized protein n=1 Tax=Nostoc parmelioides FACHB-3921 TaxID=2692909 RepID=A0ABR8BGP0_9NOSO|nr:hypothetical protein [Nostoc parmelioides]MBD2252143.1 hypothetical protein [Nostoc parmelioides FACHB-3921]
MEVVKERAGIDCNRITVKDLERRSLKTFNYKSNTIPKLPLIVASSSPTTPADVLVCVQAASQNLPETRRQIVHVINQK